MINIAKILSTTGMIVAMGWFAMRPEFAAVLVGILSLSVFMLTFLPITSDSKR
ncbi:hypothetical protein [Herminiimonas arsenitoxidans]|uniref:hypothetical protein n=1 Tax=Herminiimonas arsenitoxidans TaxID=1809410 RepID=UPI0012FF926D|nr:hypothetical protein [Herminiimonas arsenitoxidans]